MIEHSMTWCDVEKNSFTFTWDSHLHGTNECIESWIHLKTRFKLEILMKCKLKTRLNKYINFVDLLTFQALVGFS